MLFQWILNPLLVYVPWRLRNIVSFPSSFRDLESGDGEVSENSNSLNPSISSPAVSPVASKSTRLRHSSFSLPLPGPSSSHNGGLQSQVLIDWGAVGSTLIVIQCSWIVGLVPVCLVKALPAAWLGFPLIAVIFLMAIGLLLTLYWQMFALYLETSGICLNYLPVVSLIITTVAVLITAGVCMGYLASLGVAKKEHQITHAYSR